MVMTGKRGPWNGSGVLLGDEELPLPNNSVATRNSSDGSSALSGTDQPLVSVEVGHVVRRQQHGVALVRIQMAVGAVHDPRLRKHHAALGAEVRDDELMALARNRSLGQEGAAEEDQDQSLHSRPFSHYGK